MSCNIVAIQAEPPCLFLKMCDDDSGTNEVLCNNKRNVARGIYSCCCVFVAAEKIASPEEPYSH